MFHIEAVACSGMGILCFIPFICTLHCFRNKNHQIL